MCCISAQGIDERRISVHFYYQFSWKSQEKGPLMENWQARKSNRTRQQNIRGNRKRESNDSPEIPARSVTSDIPSHPSGGPLVEYTTHFMKYMQRHCQSSSHNTPQRLASSVVRLFMTEFHCNMPGIVSHQQWWWHCTCGLEGGFEDPVPDTKSKGAAGHCEAHYCDW